MSSVRETVSLFSLCALLIVELGNSGFYLDELFALENVKFLDSLECSELSLVS